MAARPPVYENTAPFAEPLYMNQQGPAKGQRDYVNLATGSPVGAAQHLAPSSSAARPADEDENGYAVLVGVNNPARPEPLLAQGTPRSNSVASKPASQGESHVITIPRGRSGGYAFNLGGGRDTPMGVCTVTHVSPDGPAFRQLLVGDIVHEINGFPVLNMTHVELLDKFRVESAHSALTLRIERRQGADDVYVEVSNPTRTLSVDTRPYPFRHGAVPTAAGPLPPAQRPMPGTPTGGSSGSLQLAAQPRTSRCQYVRNVSREEADVILTGKPIGSFLIRPSTTRAGEFILVVKTANSIEHVGPLGVPEAGLNELVERHKRSEDGLPTILKQCFA
eukprot:m.242661 g.242661  ORF g.242661 m.242661 type:complete len:335 (+) comp14079_c0_seq1:1-1005(+)